MVARSGRGRLRRLRRAVRALGPRDIRRLHQARRHRHLPGDDRPRDGARAQPRRARSLHLRGDPGDHACDRVPDREPDAARARPPAPLLRQHLALPAVPGLPRCATRVHALRVARAGDPFPAAAGGGRVPRRPARDPVRVRALGRDQGARRRAAAGPDRGPRTVDARAGTRPASRAAARGGLRDPRLRAEPSGRGLARAAAPGRRDRRLPPPVAAAPGAGRRLRGRAGRARGAGLRRRGAMAAADRGLRQGDEPRQPARAAQLLAAVRDLARRRLPHPPARLGPGLRADRARRSGRRGRRLVGLEASGLGARRLHRDRGARLPRLRRGQLAVGRRQDSGDGLAGAAGRGVRRVRGGARPRPRRRGDGGGSGDRGRRALVERPPVPRRLARPARAAARARDDRPRVRGSGARADDDLRAVRRAPLPAPPRPRGRIRAAEALRLPHGRNDARQGRVGRHRPHPARPGARLPDAGASARPGCEQAAVGLPPRLERPLLRGLAAPGVAAAHDPPAPSARQHDPGGGRAALPRRPAAEARCRPRRWQRRRDPRRSGSAPRR